MTSGPKKTPIPLEETATPGRFTGSDHRSSPVRLPSRGSHGFLQLFFDAIIQPYSDSARPTMFGPVRKSFFLQCSFYLLRV